VSFKILHALTRHDYMNITDSMRPITSVIVYTRPETSISVKTMAGASKLWKIVNSYAKAMASQP